MWHNPRKVWLFRWIDWIDQRINWQYEWANGKKNISIGNVSMYIYHIYHIYIFIFVQHQKLHSLIHSFSEFVRWSAYTVHTCTPVLMSLARTATPPIKNITVMCTRSVLCECECECECKCMCNLIFFVSTWLFSKRANTQQPFSAHAYICIQHLRHTIDHTLLNKLLAKFSLLCMPTHTRTRTRIHIYQHPMYADKSKALKYLRTAYTYTHTYVWRYAYAHTDTSKHTHTHT